MEFLAQFRPAEVPLDLSGIEYGKLTGEPLSRVRDAIASGDEKAACVRRAFLRAWFARPGSRPVLDAGPVLDDGPVLDAGIGEAVVAGGERADAGTTGESDAGRRRTVTSGCGCRAGASSSPSSPLGAFSILLALVLVRRRAAR